MRPVQGINKLFLFQIEGDAETAFKVAFQRDHSTEESRSYDTEGTIDGNIKVTGDYEASHSLTTFEAHGDTLVKRIREECLRDRNPKRLKVWELDRTELPEVGDESSTIPGDFSLDVVTSMPKSSSYDGSVEITIDTEVEGTIVSGEVTVTEELLDILKQTDAQLREFEQPNLTP